MEENQRELATNRLLEIIRSGQSTRPRPTPPPPEGEPAEGAEVAAAEAAPPAAPHAAEYVPLGKTPKPPAPAPTPEPVTPEPSKAEIPTLTPKAVEKPPDEHEEEVQKPKGLLGKVKLPRKKAPKPEPEGKSLEEAVEAALKPAWQVKLGGLFGKKPKATAEPGEEGAEPQVKRVGKVKGKRYIAYDIGSSSIKQVELVKREGEMVIDAVAVRAIPMAVRKNQSALNMFLAKTIREMLPVKHVERSELYLLLPDQSMQIRNVGLPAVAAKERVNALKFQIKKDLPFPLEVCEVTFAGYDPKVKERQEVEVFAVDRRVRTARLDHLMDAGIPPQHVTAFPTAAVRLAESYKGIDKDKGAVVIVDVGAAKTTITILDRNRLALCRTIATGGDDFTAVLQGLGLGEDGEDLNEVQAENYKREMGIPPEGDTSSMRVAILMRPVAERISSEIARSMEVFRRNTTGREIQKLLLVGGGAQMKRIDRFLANNLGVDVEIGNPASALTLSPDIDDVSREAVSEHGPALLPALAVALDSGKRQNILPAELKSLYKMKQLKRVIAPAAVLILVLLMALYSLELGNLQQYEQRIKTLQGQLGGLNAARADYLVAKSEHDLIMADLTSRESDFNGIRIDDPEIITYMKVFSHIVPPNIYLDRLKSGFIPEVEQVPKVVVKGQKPVEEAPPKSMFDILSDASKREGGIMSVRRPVYGRVMRIWGSVYPLGSLTDMQLVDFVFALEKSGYFRDVAVDSVAAQSNGKVNFAIICGI